MSEKRRGLGRGIGALIPSGPGQSPGVARPIDVFFGSSATAPSSDEARVPLRIAPTDTTQADADEAVVAVAPAAPTTADGDARQEATGTEPDSASAVGGAPDDEPTESPVGGAGARTSEPAGDQRSSDVDAVSAEDQGTAARKGGAQGSGAEPDASGGLEPAAADGPTAAEPESDGHLVPVPGATFAEVPVESITPNARQPRQVFDEDELEELAASIREVGVLQPVVVRRVPAGDSGDGVAYELIMGERRWRASQLAGNTTVPAIVRDTGDTDLLRDALLENLHRTQLNPLEEAAAYQQLLEDFGCTHDELATRIARSRPQISNTLRLLKLPPLVQRRVAAGVLSAGHARALLGLADGAAMERLAQRIVAEGLSVRATEEIVALGDEPIQPEMRRRPRAGAHSEALDRIASRLTDHLDTRVKVTMGQRKGRIAIEFAGMDDLDRILQALGEQPDEVEQQRA